MGGDSKNFGVNMALKNGATFFFTHYTGRFMTSILQTINHNEGDTMKSILILGLLMSAAVNAETEITLNDEITLADEAVEAPELNIEGKYRVEKPAPKKIVKPVKKISSSDRLKLLRTRLEERNKIMLEKKMEQIRYQQELALARQLEQSMNQTLKAIDEIK